MDGTNVIQDGDIIVFDILDAFTQATGVSRTFSLAYDGTTEASTTNNATFVSFPVTLEFYSPRNPGTIFQNPGVFMEKRNWLWLPRRPKLWRPELWRPPVHQPIPAIT